VNEKALVKRLKDMFEDSEHPELDRVFVHVNLATKRFHELWEEWWASKALARLEVDMIPLFRGSEGPLMPAVEVKYFRDTGPRDFREGLGQALSFGLFGFDSLVLWHLFPGDMPREDVESITKPCRELVEGFKLPVSYLATRLTDDGRFEFSAPWEWYSSVDVDAYRMIDEIRKASLKERNPLLDEEEVIRRRKALKVLLRIPI